MPHSPEVSWTTVTAQAGELPVIIRIVDGWGSVSPRSRQPERAVLVWNYAPEGRGMPSEDDHARMNDLEDRLNPAVEADGRSTLVMVSTGDGVREWLYYTQSREHFMEALNGALSDQPPYPIEIFLDSDPEWRDYEEIRKQLTGNGGESRDR